MSIYGNYDIMNIDFFLLDLYGMPKKTLHSPFGVLQYVLDIISIFFPVNFEVESQIGIFLAQPPLERSFGWRDLPLWRINNAYWGFHIGLLHS